MGFPPYDRNVRSSYVPLVPDTRIVTWQMHMRYAMQGTFAKHDGNNIIVLAHDAVGNNLLFTLSHSYLVGCMYVCSCKGMGSQPKILNRQRPMTEFYSQSVYYVSLQPTKANRRLGEA